MSAGEAELSAPELILSLVDSASQPLLPAARLVAAGALFGIDAGAIRVAAARLVKKGVLLQESRGVYRVGTRGDPLRRRVLAWSRVEDQLRPWDGRWFAVFTGHLRRSDKSLVRARERALRLRGFAELEPGLSVRPANLRVSLAELRADLVAWGLDEGARLLRIDAQDPERPLEPGALWDVAGLEAGYRANLARLEASQARLPHLDVEARARETLLVGRRVMHDILLDPLLPETVVDTALRRRVIDAMKVYDRLGKASWREFHRRGACG